MTEPVQRFPFLFGDPRVGESSLVPLIPLTLVHDGSMLSVHGLLDTGASVNVLPWDVGHQIGLEWDQQATTVKLAGNLAGLEARVVVLSAQVGSLPAVRLAFAWTKSNEVPALLGEVNFFLEFDVCFFRAKTTIEIRQRSKD